MKARNRNYASCAFLLITSDAMRRHRRETPTEKTETLCSVSSIRDRE